MAVVLTEIMGSENHPSSYDVTSSLPLVGHHAALLSVCLFELNAKVLILGSGLLLQGEEPLAMVRKQGTDLLGRAGAVTGHELRLVGLGQVMVAIVAEGRDEDEDRLPLGRRSPGAGLVHGDAQLAVLLRLLHDVEEGVHPASPPGRGAPRSWTRGGEAHSVIGRPIKEDIVGTL